MEAKKKEIECVRSNVTPRQFFRYCQKRCYSKGLDIESWIDYQNWINPFQKQKWHVKVHGTHDKPKREIIEYMPYSCQLAFEGVYNFIIEFSFDFRSKGHGYFYVLEEDT